MLSQLLNYKIICPLCNAKLKCENDIDNKGNLILENNSENYISVNIDTEKVKFEITYYKQTEYVSLYQRKFIPSINYATRFFGIKTSCHNCRNYDYIILCIIDFSLKENIHIKDVMINSESIYYLDDKNVNYIVRNVYTSKKTEFIYVKDNVDKSQLLPLIPINFDNIEEIVNKIKKLLIFS